MWDLWNSAADTSKWGAAVSAASRPKFHGEILRPRTGTGTVPKLAGEDACATMAPAFLGIVPRQIDDMGIGG